MPGNREVGGILGAVGEYETFWLFGSHWAYFLIAKWVVHLGNFHCFVLRHGLK